MSDTIARIPPLRESWIKRAQHEAEVKNHLFFGGVRYFANEFSLVPGKTRTDEEVREEAERLYGPPQDPMLHDSRRR